MTTIAHLRVCGYRAAVSFNVSHAQARAACEGPCSRGCFGRGSSPAAWSYAGASSHVRTAGPTGSRSDGASGSRRRTPTTRRTCRAMPTDDAREPGLVLVGLAGLEQLSGKRARLPTMPTAGCESRAA